ncbi:Chaperone protein DnaJ [Tetrabaena socialis]|uniref:Chaperone protein DnaJ n=1 Tax=Tetrabaena socialis TaxID=47790 RepID=A0A2J8A8X8_9CHLO|nr:Chaperone protein DnaJ [Tetrabaena socialis]|eukprot:PNH08978.1 Chaperone protein DnaJ [Tetrabaena socialis]
MAGRCISLTAKCPYETLGVDSDSDETEIKGAFRRKARCLHPDVNGQDPMSTIAFMECQNAYQTLLDPEKRAKYDQTLLPRANSQVLSYLNARSAARHGVPPSRVPSRSPYVDRPQLYSTMLSLLQAAKSCAKNLEREVVGKDGGKRQRVVAGAEGRRVAAAAAEAAAAECGDGDCGAPWMYHAIQSAQEEEAAANRRRG